MDFQYFHALAGWLAGWLAGLAGRPMAAGKKGRMINRNANTIEPGGAPRILRKKLSAAIGNWQEGMTYFSGLKPSKFSTRVASHTLHSK